MSAWEEELIKQQDKGARESHRREKRRLARRQAREHERCERAGRNCVDNKTSVVPKNRRG